jgi:hypothetical protein
MAEQTRAVLEVGRRESFVKELSSAAAKKALAPLAAAAATAGMTYLIRKSGEIWEERVLPKAQEKGGPKAVAKEALHKAAGRLGGRSSNALSGLAKRLSDAQPSDRGPSEQQPAAQASSTEPDAMREQERKARQQRRQQRQRALEQSGST